MAQELPKKISENNIVLYPLTKANPVQGIVVPLVHAVRNAQEKAMSAQTPSAACIAHIREFATLKKVTVATMRNILSGYGYREGQEQIDFVMQVINEHSIEVPNFSCLHRFFRAHLHLMPEEHIRTTFQRVLASPSETLSETDRLNNYVQQLFDHEGSDRLIPLWTDVLHENRARISEETYAHQFIKIYEGGYRAGQKSQLLIPELAHISLEAAAKVWCVLMSKPNRRAKKHGFLALGREFLERNGRITAPTLFQVFLLLQRYAETDRDLQQVTSAYLANATRYPFKASTPWKQTLPTLPLLTQSLVWSEILKECRDSQEGRIFIKTTLKEENIFPLLASYVQYFSDQTMIHAAVGTELDQKLIRFLLGRIVQSPKKAQTMSMVDLLYGLAVLDTSRSDLKPLLTKILRDQRDIRPPYLARILIALRKTSGFEQERIDIFRQIASRAYDIDSKTLLRAVYGATHGVPRSDINFFLRRVPWDTLALDSHTAQMLYRFLHLEGCDIPHALHLKYTEHLLNQTGEQSQMERDVTETLENLLADHDIATPIFHNVFFDGIEMDHVIPLGHGKGYMNIESDGAYHNENSLEKDMERDAYLKEHGYYVHRVDWKEFDHKTGYRPQLEAIIPFLKKQIQASVANMEKEASTKEQSEIPPFGNLRPW
ncbi:hypothetical protein COW46_04780 [Candidatus Gracilibacteria bacterium CG17_big_fil_post_rev_8_21_14_2_50_48_13]|nr:MAG: hypothetical protein COW46_04780 [Candidatus Gracilibacteria bacterium CG17_big_fil_post_rev_8_21_14_2_50_48_13]